MSANNSRFYDDLRSMLDGMAHDIAPPERLPALQKIVHQASKMIIAARNEAAYELRSKHSSLKAEALTGIEYRTINVWAEKHRSDRGLPKLKTRRSELDGAIDLSGS
jgi:hypothetical protein